MLVLSKNIYSSIFILSLILFFAFSSYSKVSKHDIYGDVKCNDTHSLLVFSEDEGRNLIERDADKRLFPASLVKVMTAYLTFEAIENGKLSFDDVLTISHRSNFTSYINGITTLHLKVGDQITVKDALYGMIVKSFNGASVALAEKISDSEWEFAKLMNKKAVEIGMNNTHFRNATGLQDNKQYTTAYDLKKLIIALRKDFPEYYRIFNIKEIEILDKKFITHNNVLLNYKGAEGMKTGFTSLAGYNLISSAFRDDQRIFSILLSCESSSIRNKVTEYVLDKAFIMLAENKN